MNGSARENTRPQYAAWHVLCAGRVNTICIVSRRKVVNDFVSNVGYSRSNDIEELCEREKTWSTSKKKYVVLLHAVGAVFSSSSSSSSFGQLLCLSLCQTGVRVAKYLIL